MSRSIQAFAFTLSFFAFSIVPVRADLIVNVGSTTIAAGGTASVDVTVTSTTGADTLSAFDLGLLITGVGTPTGFLQFSSGIDQPTPYGNGNYVFFNESTNNDLSLPLWSDPIETNYNNDTITGGDSDDGGGNTPSYVTIPSSAGGAYTYLATVQFFLPGGTQGDSYNISLVDDPGQTYFDDQNGNPLAYTSSNGLVTVEGVSAVPEPSSLFLAAVSALGGLIWHYSRGRRGRPNDTEASRIHVGGTR